jgi:tRNA(fMet)-specific endonuclease VapC
MFLLDTDCIGILQRGAAPEVGRLLGRLAAHPQTAYYWPIISFHEQVLGWNAYISRARDAAGVIRGYEMFQRVLADFNAAQVLPFDAAASAVFDNLRAQRVRVATMDLRIAATALSRGFTLLTRNVKDFGRVPGLNVEDWTA